MTSKSKITYTWTDEAPALATLSFLPIVQAYTAAAGIEVELADISLAGRIIAVFSDTLHPDQRMTDYLTELGELAKQPHANIIKLPNISASVPQLKATIAELQAQGYAVPNYPDEPTSQAEHDAQTRYDKVKGSAVNPVLREGNSDRRAPTAVKNYARKNPHSMGGWESNSQTHVSTMSSDDFRHNEQSQTVQSDGELQIALRAADGSKTILKNSVPVLAGEIVDATFLSTKRLNQFLAHEIEEAKQQGVLFSLHLKATMMKVSDPIIFGHAVRTFLFKTFSKHQAQFDEIGVNVNNGLGNLYDHLAQLPEATRQAIEADLTAELASRPPLAMVNSDKGITNLHVPSDVIVDASMPAMIRASGQMWNAEGRQQDTKAVIPDSSYAAVFAETIAFHKQHGAFDPTTMGTCPNVGLMAQKAEEYGSHDKTFELPTDGTVVVTDNNDNILFEHQVEKGDIWRMCQVKDAPIQDWVKLAVSRARATGWPAVFWLDGDRAHDAQLIRKVKAYLPQHNIEGLQIEILSPAAATKFTLGRMHNGENTISVTGNVLRDYLTDLFPILELGTSAKMLSIVPLMNGGGLFETGAGGSAPKHVQQFQAENHLRWDSLGEFLALAVSLEHLAETTGNKRAQLLATALDEATENLLNNNQSPSRKVGEIDSRGSHFHIALYWANGLAKQSEDTELANIFKPLAEYLNNNRSIIAEDLLQNQGAAVETGGYYLPNIAQTTSAMRPSAVFNTGLDLLTVSES